SNKMKSFVSHHRSYSEVKIVVIMKMLIFVLLHCLITLAYSQEIIFASPQVKQYDHWEHQYLTSLQASKMHTQLRESCEIVEKPLKKTDIYINVAAPRMSTIILPCIYCGYYSRQRKYWYKANFRWNNPWNTTLNKVENVTYYTRPLYSTETEKMYKKPDNVYRVVQRKDFALVIANLTALDAGLYSCFHRFKYDKMKGRLTYIVNLMSTYPGTTMGNYDKLRQFKRHLRNYNMDKFIKVNRFFNNTRFVPYIGLSSACRSCGGHPGFKANLVTSYLEHKDTVHPGAYHRALSKFSAGLHIRSTILRALNLPQALQDELRRLTEMEFSYFTPCMNSEPCPDYFAAPYTSAQTLPTVAYLKNRTKSMTEIKLIREFLITNAKLQCELESKEVAIWYRNRTGYGVNDTFQRLTSSLASNITKLQMKADKFVNDPRLEMVHKAFGLGQHKDIFSVSPVDTHDIQNVKSTDSGIYTCYGRNIEVNEDTLRKVYIVELISRQKQVDDALMQSRVFIVGLTEFGLFMLLHIFFVGRLVYFKGQMQKVYKDVLKKIKKKEEKERLDME
ncbi:hypothetical protein SK128_020375, partial [Halocaridina rubra]